MWLCPAPPGGDTGGLATLPRRADCVIFPSGKDCFEKRRKERTREELFLSPSPVSYSFCKDNVARSHETPGFVLLSVFSRSLSDVAPDPLVISPPSRLCVRSIQVCSYRMSSRVHKFVIAWNSTTYFVAIAADSMVGKCMCQIYSPCTITLHR